MENTFLKYPLNLQLFAETDTTKNGTTNIDDAELDDDDFDETDKEKSGDPVDKQPVNLEENLEEKKKSQSREENARNAERRRQKEQKEREKLENDAYERGKKEGQLASTKVNTFTNAPITDEYDLKIFEIQKKIEARGGDPIGDLPIELAKIQREETKQKEELNRAEIERQAKIKKDLVDFTAKYKDVNVTKLFEDKTFANFSKNRLGEEDLTTVYEDYLELKKEIEDSIQKDVAKKLEDENAKKKGGTPSPNGGGKKTSTPYSQLSKEERIKELKKQGLI